MRASCRVCVAPSRAALCCAAPLCATLAILTGGCEGSRYEVEVWFASAPLRDAAQSVEVAFVRECPDPLGPAASAPVRARAVTRGAPPMAFGDLEPASYGLYGRALDAECGLVAAGCEEVTVEPGGDGRLRVRLAEASGFGCAAGELCVQGRCGVGPDAGPAAGCPGGCDDGDDCTDDLCLEGECVYATRDRDGDGHGDARCPEVGGVPADDCDDARPEANPLADEQCNGQDEDCDETVDEGFECALAEAAACQACGPGERVCEAPSCTLGPCRPRLDPELVAAWSFDDEPARDAIGEATGAHPGAVVGADAVYVDGPRYCGQAFAVDGASPYAEIPHAPAFDLSSGSLRLWVRFDADRRQGVFSRDAGGRNLPGHLSVWRRGDGAVVARIQNLDGQVTRCGAPVANGVWHEVLVRWGAPDFELIVDGRPAADDVACSLASNVGGIVGNQNPIVLGARSITSEEGLATPVDSPLVEALGHVALRAGRADPAAPEVVGFTLVDAATDTELGALADGARIDASATPDFTVRVNVDPIAVDRVEIAVDGEPPSIERRWPFSVGGGSAGDLAPWRATPGPHEIRVTAFASPTVAGPTRTITVFVE